MSYFTEIITTVLLYVVFVGALHSKCCINVASNLFSGKYSVMCGGGATNVFPSYWVATTETI